ncbi:hypothetical protein ACFQZ2_00870 [Streptomonospora algeriensis]|uniref:Uncharacterized protein n=1 Tax=Streptomonospora algeriensis TaxID=995084 RepID=A0ABW3B9Z7_9ACTN
MTMHRRRFLGGAAALTLASFSTPAAPAAADNRGRWRPPRRVHISLTHSGWDMAPSGPLREGATAFHTVTEDASGHYFSILRMREGTTIERALELLQASSDPDPEVALPARRAFYREVEQNGGTAVYPGQQAVFTKRFDPGVLYLGEAPAQWVPDRPPFHVDPVEVADAGRSSCYMRSDVRLVADSAPEGVAIEASRTRFRSDAVICFSNRTGVPQELIFRRLLEDAGQQDVTEYYESVGAGDPLPSPFTEERFGGMLPISPGLAATLRVSGLPAARYCIVSHVKDPGTGLEQAVHGARRIVELSAPEGS